MSSPDDAKPSGTSFSVPKAIDLITKVELKGIYVDANISAAAVKHFLTKREAVDQARIELLVLDDYERQAAMLVKEMKDKASEPAPAEPPSALMLSLMMPAATSEDIIANMHDLYSDSWVPRYGKRRADWIWHWQVVQFILWRWTWPVMSLLGALKLIKLG
ncbi:hypothetical protein [Mesorhizobium sp. M7A.F.Ca.MR.245.00.0.0]|uniref:hypothetical protein n=1 Tax=Mesorhizobium sp. M7A.F.Ca.MR.245.00.0.0 TaxID=2496778 RepID=UPI000FCCACE3|nr:hypothetical protein [Mesorhizobium sp. M7A.F.Ca.MR.245.00.0.0]RUV19953.1 hypothetical protein EOB80_17195 [Mesorhizobium sp. M7A.F.Ca.MR.245.00.0.0]RUV53791.1 hypothetical protein EOB77_00650 [Mesorhizobium sp. M7A.F.Ca.MR.228.00.0.0]